MSYRISFVSVYSYIYIIYMAYYKEMLQSCTKPSICSASVIIVLYAFIILDCIIIAHDCTNGLMHDFGNSNSIASVLSQCKPSVQCITDLFCCRYVLNLVWTHMNDLPIFFRIALSVFLKDMGEINWFLNKTNQSNGQTLCIFLGILYKIYNRGQLLIS